MKRLHEQEKKQFKKLFKQERIADFENRLIVLEAFLQTEKHVTVDELTALLKDTGHQLESEFVKDTLKLMCRFGFAHQSRFDNGDLRYEHHHLGQHHDHMVCAKCRKIIEFHDDRLESLQSDIAATHGFQMFQHRMELYGICAQCQQERLDLMALTAARAGEKVLIKDITGGSSARLHLLSMGLRIGDTVEVISNNGQGQIAVAVDYHRYVLGRGLARKIVVESTDTG
jgi:Fur family ferric uptake transcriptional regulator